MSAITVDTALECPSCQVPGALLSGVLMCPECDHNWTVWYQQPTLPGKYWVWKPGWTDPKIWTIRRTSDKTGWVYFNGRLLPKGKGHIYHGPIPEPITPEGIVKGKVIVESLEK